MLFRSKGKVTARINSLPYYDSAARHGAHYAPSALQREALIKVQEIANRPQLMLTMTFEEGDIQLINNYTVLHGRTGYEDHPEPERRRHLLRLWLKIPGARSLPPEFANGRARTGIPVQSMS